MITLKTLPEATAQEVFDQVVTHLRQQGKPSRGDSGGCLYRNDQGLKCAAGCLIGDDEYTTDMDFPESGGSDWSCLIENGVVPYKHRELISELQHVHDHNSERANMYQWEDGFADVANKFSLVYKENVNDID